MVGIVIDSPKLSPRLKLVASLVKKDSVVVDVGTDHAMLPVFLVANKIAKKVYATEINPLPYKKAKKNIDDSGFQKNIDVFLCGGISFVPKDYDTVTICGMGGEMIAEILSDEKPKKSVSLILQPMTAPVKLRRFLYENGYVINREELAKEGRRLYSVIYAIKGQEEKTPYREIEAHVSKAMAMADKSLYYEYINKIIKKHTIILKGFKSAENNYEKEEKYSIDLIEELITLKND